jgi:glycosyltransferase involved in cell wall biosynthesis
MEEVLADARQFDIIHFHTGWFEFPVFRGHPTPCLTTLHGRLDVPEIHARLQQYPEFPFVSISHAQRTPLPKANWLATVHHGIPDGEPRPGPWGEGYLAFLGRIAPEKRPDLAIEIAGRAGMPLKIAAKVDRVDEEYFATVIEPLLRQSHVEFVGELDEAQKMAFLAGARALLFPIDWPEPFGLVMIEAMACGTPVIAFRRGSVPEVVEDGITGFIVEDPDGAVAALGRLGSLDRRRIRQVFRRRFAARRMAQRYARLYGELVEARRARERNARHGHVYGAAEEVAVLRAQSAG